MASNREFLLNELGFTEEEAFEKAQGDGWTAGYMAAVEACAAEADKAASETLSDNAEDALSALAARLRKLVSHG